MIDPPGPLVSLRDGGDSRGGAQSDPVDQPQEGTVAYELAILRIAQDTALAAIQRGSGLIIGYKMEGRQKVPLLERAENLDAAKLLISVVSTRCALLGLNRLEPPKTDDDAEHAARSAVATVLKMNLPPREPEASPELQQQAAGDAR